MRWRPKPYKIWFAWYPVKVGTTSEWIWLEKVMAQRQLGMWFYYPLSKGDK